MSELLSAPPTIDAAPGPRTLPALALGAAGVGTALAFGALGLWLHYGTAVFFEMIASGFAACF